MWDRNKKLVLYIVVPSVVFGAVNYAILFYSPDVTDSIRYRFGLLAFAAVYSYVLYIKKDDLAEG